MKKTGGKNIEKSFEDYMARLQDIVNSLQTGELPLQQSLELYKEGLDCSKHCRAYLEQAKKDIEIWQQMETENASCQSAGRDNERETG